MDGEIRKTTYDYPDGYLLRGVGHLTVEDRAQILVMDVDRFKP